MAVTWNPSDANTNVVLSNGNRTVDTNSASVGSVRATTSFSTGKKYFEVKVNLFGSRLWVGIADSLETLSGDSSNANTFRYYGIAPGFSGNDSVVDNNNSNVLGPSYGTAVNDVYQIAIDMTNHLIYFGRNNTWLYGGNPSAGTGGLTIPSSVSYFPFCGIGTGGNTISEWTGNFSLSQFAFTPPTGFTAWDSTATGTAAVAGSAAVSASPVTVKPVSQAITGTGAVSVRADILNLAFISASGTVSATASITRTANAAIAGSGTVSSSASVRGAGSSSVAGAGAVSVTVSVLRAARAAIGVTATVAETISDPISAANSLGEFTSAGVAVSYNPNYVPASPLGATNPCLQNVVPSYLYEQYQDDDDLQAFVAAYNTITQQYVSWLNDYTLPVYTNPLITGDLLDWVARGLYGVERPSLSAGSNVVAGPYNSNVLNYLTYNGRKTLRTAVYTPVDDDIFKRILTWKLYKGDGKVMNIRWLKRRVYRFLFGPNGTDVNCGDTSGISVTFEDGTGITITVITETTTSDARVPLFNAFRFNEANFDVAKMLTKTTQSIETYTHGNGVRITLLDNPPNAAIFQEAVEQGILDLPFQFDFLVSI